MSKIIGQAGAEQGVSCTDCGQCVRICPCNVSIPAIMRALNVTAAEGDLARARQLYGQDTSQGTVSSCIGCGICENVCPEHLPIIRHLQKAKTLFE